MKRIATALLFSAAISAPAFAADAGTAYIAADYGTWSMYNAGFPNPSVISLSGGYHFTPNVGVEVGYAAVGDSTVNYGSGSSTFSQSALKVAAVGTYSVATQFDVFGKIGFDSISGKWTDTFLASQSTSTTNLMYGIGGQYNINKQFGLRLQYERLGKTKAASAAPGADVTSTSIGVVYNF